MRRAFRLVIAVVVLLGLGAGVAFGLSSALGLRTESKDVPVENLVAAQPQGVVPDVTFDAIDAPDDERIQLAVEDLRDALGTTDGGANLTVTAGADPESETYRVTGSLGEPRIEAEGVAGAALALHDFADRARTGRYVLDDLGSSVTPSLPYRMVDLGAVGVTPDEEVWAKGTDYSHASKAFEEVLLRDAPYVDEQALTGARTDLEAYVEHVAAQGYNAIAVPGLIEYLTFDRVGDGHEIYPEGDEHVARALAMREGFGALWKRAHDLGLKVFLRTDMLALTTPLEEYLDAQGWDAEDPELWDVYAAGLDELYDAMPYLDGVLIRIGEAGKIYDVPGLDYYSALDVTTVAGVRQMLTSLSEQAEKADREVIFRSWSVGVGAVGDMHTNADSYREVLDGIDSPNLIVSTKYTLGDFYSHLPFNDTLDVGDQRRIIELQSRREFEAYGSLPNDLGPLYAQALERFADANVEGIWTWTQDGGPWRAGPMSLELKSGFWQLYELNTYAAARLARDPAADPAEITADWTRRWFSDDPGTIAAITEAMALSRDAVVGGLYIGPFAEERVFAIGLEPPPMMWIFEWDILTGDSAVLDVVHAVTGDRLGEAIDEGRDAVATAERMRDLVAATDATTWKDPRLHDHFLDTLDYQVDLFDVLADYRAMTLNHVEWLETGSSEARDAWSEARDDFRSAAARHEKEWGGDVDLPAYNLTAAEIGLDRAERDRPMAWAATALLVGVVSWLVVGVLGLSRAARAHVVGAFAPWRVASQPDRGRLALLVGVPAVVLVLSRAIFTWFAAPAHLVLVLGAWALFVLAVVVLVPRAARVPVLAAVGGAALLRSVLLLAVLSIRGPGHYWLMMWTQPSERFLYVTVAFALFGWVVVAGCWALASVVGTRRAVGVGLVGVGAPMVGLGLLVWRIGLEDAMTIWNDQLALLPWGLSRILGITVYLGIPQSLPVGAAILGGILLLIGLVLRGRIRPARLG